MKEFITVSELAKEFGFSRQAVSRWLLEGKVKYIKLPNGQYRIPKEEIKRLKEC